MLQRFDERNRDILVNINSNLIPREEAGVSPFDSVVQGGDAVWEGLRLYNGRCRSQAISDRMVTAAARV